VVSSVEPSYEELAQLVVALTARLGQADAQIAALTAEVAALRAQRGKDSTNSSIPPSADSIAAKARRKIARSQRVRSKDRKPGGQPGHSGSGLVPTQDPDRTEYLDPAAECAGCGADLAVDGVDAQATWAQVWDTLPVVWEKVHYVLGRRRCRCCGKLATPVPPFGQAGAVTYGPAINAAAVLLSSQGNVPVEATAAMMDALLDAPVSAGFVARAHQRLADTLDTAGFDTAMTTALRAEDVLCGDESPVNVVSNVDPEGQPADGSPQVVTIRTPDERLVWFTAMTSRSAASIQGLGVLDGWRGVLVRDDYAGWYQFDGKLGGVQQCCSHLLRYLHGVAALDDDQQWATQVADALRDAARLLDRAAAAGTPPDADALAKTRWRYDQGVAVGISTNLSRPWHK
jgi:hypothetical protein